MEHFPCENFQKNTHCGLSIFCFISPFSRLFNFIVHIYVFENVWSSHIYKYHWIESRVCFMHLFWSKWLLSLFFLHQKYFFCFFFSKFVFWTEKETFWIQSKQMNFIFLKILYLLIEYRKIIKFWYVEIKSRYVFDINF